MHSTATHMDEACGAKGPRMYLRSERLADVLEEYGDVVKLAIFAHTHMDEVRVFKAAGGKRCAGKDGFFDFSDQRECFVVHAGAGGCGDGGVEGLPGDCGVECDGHRDELARGVRLGEDIPRV